MVSVPLLAFSLAALHCWNKSDWNRSMSLDVGRLVSSRSLRRFYSTHTLSGSVHKHDSKTEFVCNVYMPSPLQHETRETREANGP